MVRALDVKLATVFAVLGALSGLASAMIGIERPLEGLQPVASVFGMHPSLLPVGVCFALAMGMAAFVALRTLWPLLPVMLATLYGWSGAVHIAIRLQRNIGDEAHLLAASLAAGAFGAGLVFVGFAIAAPQLRQWRGLAITSGVGALAGLLFAAGERGLVHKQALFLIWQPAVALTIGALLARASRDAGDKSAV